MKPAVKTEEKSEYFEIEYLQSSVVIRCQVMLDSWNIREFKRIMADPIVFQPMHSILLDLQGQPVGVEYFQVIVQAAQTMKALHKNLQVLNPPAEFTHSIAANGLKEVIHLWGEAGEAQNPSSAGVDNFPPETRILIIDDIQSVRSLLRAFLGELGYQNVTEARGGDEGMRLIETAAGTDRAFQVVICDWYMPGMNGLQVHRRVKESQAQEKPIFILLTVETEKVNVLKAFQEGVKYYLVKPFRQETLREKLHEIWAKNPAER